MRQTPTSRDLRQNNRAAVLRKIVLDGETTRAELAASCGLSAATVTTIVADLIRDGLVRETGLRPSGGGRPMARLGAAPEAAYVIGVDVRENGVTAELFDLRLNRVDRVSRKLVTRNVSPERVTSAVSDAVATLRKAHPGPDASLAGIGLGVPGIVDVTADGTTTIYAQSLGWAPIVVDQLFRVDDDVPVYADNGAKTLATAESWFGAGRGAGHAIFALVGRGLGAGVIAGGRVLRGHASSAGEWGHTKVSIGGPRCQCGGSGCLEAYVGVEAIMRRWDAAQDGRDGRDGWDGARDGRAGTHAADETGLAKLLQAAAAGDSVAREVVSETVEILGMGLANLVNLFNPECIVVGGWVGIPLIQARRGELEQAIRRHSLHRPGEQFRLEGCVLGDDALPLGAALLPLDRLIEGDISAPKASI